MACIMVFHYRAQMCIFHKRTLIISHFFSHRVPNTHAPIYISHDCDFTTFTKNNFSNCSGDKVTKLKKMEGETQHYRLRWNNHLHNIATTINELLENEIFTDVTLAVESGWNIKCHKMVLAACSTYFQNLFNDLSCAHPIVVLQNVKEEEIKAILSYMYNGEVSVAQDQLPSLIKVAENLKVHNFSL